MIRAAPALLALVLLVVATAVGPPPAAAQDGAAPLLTDLLASWAERDAAGVAALFAPDGVIQIDPSNPNGPDLYVAGREPGLALGVRTLMGGALAVDASGARAPTAEVVQIDVAGRQESGFSVHGAPATLIQWRYGKAGAGVPAPLASRPALPPETGTDELVIRAGRIASYTRTPDPASVEARRWVLGAAVRARVGQESRENRPAAPDTQARATPSMGPWVLALGVCLASIVLLALLKRPAAAP